MTEEAEDVVSSWDEAAGMTRFGLLGPVLVEVDGVERVVTARRQRSVLACLAVHAGEAVSADRLLDEVWGEETPGTGVKAVAFQISKLRSLLEPVRDGPGSLLITTSAGYLLDVDPDQVDMHHFDRLVTEARDVLPTDPARSEALVARALRLWRGRPFADLADESFAEVAFRRLEAGRLLARHTLAEARIAQGRHTEAIGDLEVIAAEQPLEETAVQLLMLALYRSGRTADALRAYGGLRLRLGSELGIEPSRDLQRLEQQLLAGGVEHLAITVPERVDGTGAQGNLPTPLSTFVGRTDEIKAISEMLAPTRLVSLVSFGGAGKTRLAIEVARNLADQFDDGVWFVDLIPISEPSPLADTFAAGVGLRVTLDGDPAEYLFSQLANRDTLIVVDNCEHLIDAVADLVERLVRAAPNVRVLATSRLPLGVPGEAVWHVRPLAIVSASSELFENRARLVRPGFVVDDTNRAVVEQVCERLDGIPLAIELATARLKTMTVQQIAEHLDDRFGLLTRADRGVGDRQRSLHATMKWSYDLLEECDQALLRALSVFSDGCTFGAAEEIGRHSLKDDEGPSSIDILDGLGRLVDSGLIAFDEITDLARYRVLETVREFASDQLDHNEQNLLRDAHARYFAAVAARVDELYFVDHRASLALGDQEVGNLRSAIDWAFTNDEPRLGMSIAIHLFSYFWSRTLNRENVRWSRTALQLIDDDDDAVMFCAAGMLVDANNIADRNSQAFAEERLRRGLRTIDDPAIKSRALMALATAVMDLDPRGAESLLEEAWLAAPTGPRSIALLNNRIEQSWLTGTLDDGDKILRRLDQILALLPETPQTAVKIQAGVAACAGRWGEVIRLTEDYARFDDAPKADLRLLRSEALGAVGRMDEAITVIPPMGVDDYASYIQDVHRVLAPIDLARGDAAAALHRLTVLADMYGHDDRRLAIAMYVATFLAVAAHDLEQAETAAVLFGFAAGERARLDIVLRPSVRPLVERVLDACRAELGEQRFDELAESGADKEWADLPGVIPAPTLTGL